MTSPMYEESPFYNQVSIATKRAYPGPRTQRDMCSMWMGSSARPQCKRPRAREGVGPRTALLVRHSLNGQWATGYVARVEWWNGRRVADTTVYIPGR